MLTNEYVLGLVDGEGCFHIRINENNRRSKVEFKFSLKLRHQDKEILHELQMFFGCGNVYIQRDKRANHSLCYRFEVQNRREIFNIIIPFFEENLPKIPSRYQDFMLFKEIAGIARSNSVDLEQIKSLKSKMHWGLAVYGKTVRTVGTRSS